MRSIVTILVVVLAANTCLSQETLPGLRFWQVQREIRQSLQNRDYETAFRLLNESDKAVPNNPRTIFRKAIVEASLHKDRDAVQDLYRLIEMNVYFDLSNEPAFVELKRVPDFVDLTREMEQIKTTSHVEATVAFRISDPQFFPEGIAYDARSADYFVASVRKRKIVRINSRGAVSDFISQGQNGIWGVSGIGVDPNRRRLWACSTAFEANEGYTAANKNDAALFAFNTDSGKLVGKFPLQKPGADHFCDGLAVATDGTVFVADSQGLIIYQLKQDARELEVVVNPEAGISPQGLALSASGKTLFVSNYLSGLYAVDLKSRKISTVVSQAKESLAGIDGLISCGKDLIAIQNGIEPHRVVRLRMSNDGTSVTAVQLLEVNHPLFDGGEPTLGLVNGNSLVFVANNPISRFLEDHKLERLPDPIILKRELRSR